MSKKVTVELTGTARIRAGRKEVSITVGDGMSWRDVLAILARKTPSLVGHTITEDRRGLIWPYLLNLGGGHTIHDLDGEARLKEGDRLVLFQATC